MEDSPVAVVLPVLAPSFFCFGNGCFGFFHFLHEEVSVSAEPVRAKVSVSGDAEVVLAAHQEECCQQGEKKTKFFHVFENED